MSIDHSERVRELFEAALACSPEQRDHLLRDHCSGDTDLRDEVESLLAHAERVPPDFLQPLPAPTVPSVDSEDPDPLIGATVGQYHIKGIIAAGGMGTVYEAVQEHPHRTVALKVMHRNVASRSALRRFQFEPEVLARLRHPNIAQVYEAGTHDPEPPGSSRPVPFFALEYIPGAKSICEYAEAKDLSISERLAMFAKVCEAVHHGHQKSIIHRDLKPANILVDSYGEVKIIDFGVARAADSDLARQTVTGQLIGTMQYMSPEQCDADSHDLDTRTDVYSLGVVLYEPLSGELPYEISSSTIYQATQVIKEHAPRSLSSANPKLGGDVEAIVLQALEKDREQRYASAADLGQDIRRFLNRQPIEARPPTSWVRAVHWVTRHPAATTAVGCLSVAAVIIAATWISIWFFNAQPHHMDLLNRRGEQVEKGGHEARAV